MSPTTAPTATTSVDESVPAGLRIAGAFGWRLLIVAAVLALFGYVVAQLRLIAIPFFVAILLAALLVPFVGWLVRHRWPKWLAVTTAMLTLIGAVAGLVTLVITQVRAEAPELYERSLQAYDQFAAFLLDSPLHLTEADIAGYTDQIVQAVQRDSQVLLSGAITVGSTAGHLLAGTLLTLFATLFMLIDGKSIWRWAVGLFPKKARVAVDGAGTSGWITLTTFVKVQIFVAFIDAVGIGLGAWILGLVFGGFPLVIPIAIAVFLGSFIPIVGAVATGALAVLIALVYLGPLPAIIMLGIVLLVQQVEGHILQPLVMGSAVKVHPLAVIFAVAAGSFLAGIPGALFAVPVIAVVNVIVRYIADGRWRDRTGLDPWLRDAV